MDDNRDMEDLGGMDDGRKGFSLSKGERKHLEKVAKARAKAARQTVEFLPSLPPPQTDRVNGAERD